MVRLISGGAVCALLSLGLVPIQARAQTVTPTAPAAPPGDSSVANAPVSPLSLPEAQDQDQNQDTNKSKTPAAPPTLPGSHAHPIPAAPPDRDTSDLNPTQILFDAINRGDIAAAREAIGRGADLSGHNELGQTPLAMSVDLGRNDITFLLLSMRGTAIQDTPPPGNAPETIRTAVNLPSGAAADPSSATTDDVSPKPEAGFLGFTNLPAGH